MSRADRRLEDLLADALADYDATSVGSEYSDGAEPASYTLHNHSTGVYSSPSLARDSYRRSPPRSSSNNNNNNSRSGVSGRASGRRRRRDPLEDTGYTESGTDAELNAIANALTYRKKALALESENSDLARTIDEQRMRIMQLEQKVADLNEANSAAHERVDNLVQKQIELVTALKAKEKKIKKLVAFKRAITDTFREDVALTPKRSASMSAAMAEVSRLSPYSYER